MFNNTQACFCSVQLQGNVHHHPSWASAFRWAETDLWTALLGNISTQVSRRHLKEGGAAAAPGSGSQALQAWSSAAQSSATTSHFVSEATLRSVLGPTDPSSHWIIVLRNRFWQCAHFGLNGFPLPERNCKRFWGKCGVRCLTVQVSRQCWRCWPLCLNRLVR